MPANFTEKQRKVIRNSLLTIGYDLIREVGLKKMNCRKSRDCNRNLLSFL